MRTVGAARFFLWAAIPAALLLAVVFPPFQEPDEPTHFYRALAIATGDLLARGGGGTGAMLPTSAAELAAATLDLRGNPERKIPDGWWEAARRLPLEAQRRSFVDCRNATIFPFVAYLPQAIVLAPALALGARPLVLFFLARLASLVAGTALLVLALRLTPERKWLLAGLALAPMATSLRASASCDALLIGCACVLGAASARLERETEERRAVRAGWAAVAAATVLTLTKLPYLPLALVPLVVLWRRRAAPGPARRMIAVLALGLLAATAFTVWQAASHPAPLRPGVERDRQVHDAVVEPARFFALVANDYLRYTPRYLVQAIGVQLGWLDTRLPWWLVFVYAGALGALLLERGDSEGRASPALRWTLALALVVTLVLLSASQYVIWTPYGLGHIEGLQGRYYLPLVPFVALLVPRLRRGLDPRWRLAGLIALLVVTYAVTTQAAWTRYYR